MEGSAVVRPSVVTALHPRPPAVEETQRDRVPHCLGTFLHTDLFLWSPGWLVRV